MSNDIGGVWRTIGGRRVFIKDGKSLSEAMKESGKFKNLTKDDKNDNIHETFEFKDIGETRTIEVYNSNIIQEHYDETTEKLLKVIENDKNGLNYEVGHLLDKDGSVLYEIVGEEHGVNIEDYMIPDCKNAIFTHNHPTGFGFSQNDILSFLEYDMYEIRANTYDGKVFSLRKGNSKVDTIGFANAFYKEKPTNGGVVLDYIEKEINSGKITNSTLSKIHTNEDWTKFTIGQRDKLVNEFMKNNASKYGFVYEVV